MGQANRQKNFLVEFQKKIKRGRWLLEENSHHWATRLFLDLFFQVESEIWLSKRQKQQLVLEICHTWREYISSISSTEDYDIIKVFDGFNRFLNFLLKTKNYTLFKEYANILIKKLLKRPSFSTLGLIKLINSITPTFVEQGDWIQVVELQILAIFLAKDFTKIKHFKSTKEYLEKIIRNIEPSDRKMFFYSVLENIHRKFNVSGKPNEFNGVLINKLNKKGVKLLQEDIKSLQDIKVNEETYQSVNDQLFALYLYLMHIGEPNWGMVIAKTLFHNVKKFKTIEEAINQLYECIAQFTDKCLFDEIYELFIFLEEYIKADTQSNYNKTVIELWAKACNIFATKEEKTLLFLALEKLTKHLSYPDNSSHIFHYFHTYNYLWQFKSQYLSFDKKDFWKMLFYRALYQFNDISLAEKIIPFLDTELRPQIKDLNSLLEVKEKEGEIYHLPQTDEIPVDFKDLKVANMIIKISSEGEFSYRVHYSNQNIYEKALKKEHWNSIYLIKLYRDLFSSPSERKYDFSLKEFGKLIFLSLPSSIRDYFSKFSEQILKPQISFVFDEVKIPFELLYCEEGFIFLNYSLGYRCGRPSIMGSRFFIEQESSSSSQSDRKFNVLLLDSINALAPKRWNEKRRKKEPLYEFSAGPNQLDFAKNLFKDTENIEQYTALTGSESRAEDILKQISLGNNHIIYIVGNLIFLESHPEYSYFITNDEEILNITELLSVLELKTGNIRPLLCLDVKIWDEQGTLLKNPLENISKIMRKISFNNIKGVLARIYPEFNNQTKQIISEFFTNLLKANNLGISLFKARKSFALPLISKLRKQQENSSKNSTNDNNEEITIERIRPSLSFLLFGEPWNKL